MHGLIDTHVHLDASDFDDDRAYVVQSAQGLGVSAMLVPAVSRSNFDKVLSVAGQFPCCYPALGIHPCYASQSTPAHLEVLKAYLRNTDSIIAIGEIGLDMFVDKTHTQQQEFYFSEQLKLAHEFNLPVLLHCRRAHDIVLKFLRQYRVRGGIVHAFNGSLQQAYQFIALGFKLGFGGAMTHDRASRIRRLAKELPISGIVLETDAPDMRPAWVTPGKRNSPENLPGIAQTLAELRSENLRQTIDDIVSNVIQIVPQLAGVVSQ